MVVCVFSFLRGIAKLRIPYLPALMNFQSPCKAECIQPIHMLTARWNSDLNIPGIIICWGSGSLLHIAQPRAQSLCPCIAAPFEQYDLLPLKSILTTYPCLCVYSIITDTANSQLFLSNMDITLHPPLPTFCFQQNVFSHTTCFIVTISEPSMKLDTILPLCLLAYMPTAQKIN